MDFISSMKTCMTETKTTLHIESISTSITLMILSTTLIKSIALLHQLSICFLSTSLECCVIISEIPLLSIGDSKSCLSCIRYVCPCKIWVFDMFVLVLHVKQCICLSLCQLRNNASPYAYKGRSHSMLYSYFSD